MEEYDFDPIAEWGDDYIDSTALAAGCVAIAVGQILAYNKYPELKDVIDDDDADWDAVFPDLSQWLHNPDSLIIAEDKQEDYIAKLVHASGVGCDMKYGFMGTGSSFATPNAAKKYLASIGYNNVKRHLGYDLDIVISQLQNDCPILIGAISGVVNGHAWVVDSYKKINTIKSLVRNNGTVVSQTIESTSHYIHCNWGWGGSSDGWFSSDLLEADGRIDPSDAESFDYPNMSPESGAFTWWFRMVTYDKPDYNQ